MDYHAVPSQKYAVLSDEAPEVVYPSKDRTIHAFPRSPIIPNSAIIPVPPDPHLEAPEVSNKRDSLTQKIPVPIEEPCVTPTPTTPSGRIVGLRKRTLIVAIVITVIVIAGAIAGATIATLKKKSGSKNTAPANSEGVPTSVPTNASTSIPLAIGDRGIAASVPGSSDDSQTSIQLVYQDLNTLDLKYKLYWPNTAFLSEQNISLQYPANKGTPVSVAANTNTGGYLILNIFYLTGNTNIALVTLRCTTNEANCDKTSETLVTSSYDIVHQSTKLAAAYLSDSKGLRVYFQSAAGDIHEYTGSSAKWKHGAVGGNAVIGSNIAVTVGKNTAIHVTYVGEGDAGLTYIQWVSGTGWLNPVTVIPTTTDDWASNAPLSMCYEATPDLYRIYYVGPSSRKIHEVYKTGASSTTWSDPGHHSTWAVSNSSVSAVGWTDQVRLLYQTNDSWVTSPLSNTTWGQMQYLAD